MSLTSFIFGALGASFALLLELIILNIGPVFDYATATITFSGIMLLITVAFIEELCKFIFLRQYLIRFQKEVILSKALVLGLFFGAGFATLEIAFAIADQRTPVEWFPLVGILLVHIITSLIIITVLAHQKATQRFIGFALLVAMSIHFLYNALLSFIF